jgi:uncharacterized protein (TIGR04255 family)
MGVQFDPLPLLLPYVGLFWETVRSSYPCCSENPPIAPQLEDLSRDAPPGAGKVTLAFSEVPLLPRGFFVSEAGNWLIQLQRDRFLHNWRSISAADEYPRYEVVKERFLSQWGNFRRFVAENKDALGSIRLTQCEITYLNHIGPWSTESDLGDVFPDFQWRKGDRLLAKPDFYSVSCAFTSSEKRSRLRATIKPGVHKERGAILLLDLTVRGDPENSEGEGLETWFDEGRRWIVTAFADLTSEKWHRTWGRTQ